VFSGERKAFLDLGKESRWDGGGGKERRDRFGWKQVALHKLLEEVTDVPKTVGHVDHMLLQVSKQVLESTNGVVSRSEKKKKKKKKKRINKRRGEGGG
jgi:hypothetical protein